MPRSSKPQQRYKLQGTGKKGVSHTITVPREYANALGLVQYTEMECSLVGDAIQYRKVRKEPAEEPAAPAVNREAPAANTVVVPTVPEVPKEEVTK